LEGLYLVLKTFRDYVTESNWNANVTITTMDGNHSLAMQYSQTTDKELGAHATTLSGTQTPLAQNLSWMLDDHFKLKGYMNKALYTLAGVKSRKLFLMEIIKLVNVVTWSVLPASMVIKLNNDTKAINKYIINQSRVSERKDPTRPRLGIGLLMIQFPPPLPHRTTIWQDARECGRRIAPPCHDVAH
jgi:hypothetical protein